MSMQTAQIRSLRRGFALACAIVGAMAVSSTAFAGECPANKMKPNAREMVDYKPVGVSDITLGAIDLGKQPAISRAVNCASAS